MLFTTALLLFWSPQAKPRDEISCAFVVISRGERKKEIQAQVKAVLAGESDVYMYSTIRNASMNKTNGEQLGELRVVQLIKQVVEKCNRSNRKRGGKTGCQFGSIMMKLISLHQPEKSPSHPAASCSEIMDFDESTPSGYYWLMASDESSVRMYCDMTRSCNGATGPWMKVAMLDMTNSSNECPAGL